jgi:hypothetical protein
MLPHLRVVKGEGDVKALENLRLFTGIVEKARLLPFVASRGWSKCVLAVLGLLVSGLATETSLAASDENRADGSLLDSKYTLTFGGFFPRIDSSLDLSSPRGGGTEISIEDDLGLDDTKATAWVGFSWRFQPRHQLQVEWFELDRDGSATAGRSFEIFDTTIGVGASLGSKVDLNLGRVTYGYSFFRKEKVDLSFLVGAHIATLKATITASGNVSVNGMPIGPDESVTESSSSKTVPLPHIGGSLIYEFTPRWVGRLNVFAFALDIGEYRGSLVEFDAFMAYQLTRHFGIGGGFKYFNLNLDYDQSDGGSVDYEYEFFGPALFGYVSF